MSPRESVGPHSGRRSRRSVAALYWRPCATRPGDTGATLSVNPAAPRSASRHLRQLGPSCAFVMAARKPTGTSAPRGALDEGAEDGGGVDDRVGCWAWRGWRSTHPPRPPGAGPEILLVLAAGRPQMDMRVDERRREHIPRVPPDAARRSRSGRARRWTVRVSSMPWDGRRRGRPRRPAVLSAVLAEEHQATSSISRP